jgi:DNA repair exonuclease SbcCD ATPase subunit
VLTVAENKSLNSDRTLLASRERLENLPNEQRRLAARLADLRERRQPAAKAVAEARVLVDVGRGNAADLARKQDLLRDLDHDIDATAQALDDLSTAREVLQQVIKEREVAVRAEMAPPLAAEALRISEQVVVKLQELRPLVQQLQALDDRVNEFSRYSTTGFEIFDRALTARGPVAALVRFFSGRVRGGFDFEDAVERFQGFVDDVRSRVK